jgi:hypothetical protein
MNFVNHEGTKTQRWILIAGILESKRACLVLILQILSQIFVS